MPQGRGKGTIKLLCKAKRGEVDVRLSNTTEKRVDIHSRIRAAPTKGIAEGSRVSLALH